jgi:exosortase/archaeosortase family protein
MYRIKKLYLETSDLNRFLIKGGVLFMVWRVFRKWLLLEGEYSVFTQQFSLLYLNVSQFFLNVFGFETASYFSGRRLWIAGSNQSIEIVYDCLGTSLFFTFLIFLLAYPGRIRTKLWYIPMGFAVIFVLNAARMAALTVIVSRWPNRMDLFHHYIFQGFIFASIFLMWILFIHISKQPKAQEKVA